MSLDARKPVFGSYCQLQRLARLLKIFRHTKLNGDTIRTVNTGRADQTTRLCRIVCIVDVNRVLIPWL